jgi:hypothetical protein
MFKSWKTKAIARRKSVTPGPEDSPTSSPSSSFRIMPRNEANRRSFASSVDKPLPPALDSRNTWPEEDYIASNRYSSICVPCVIDSTNSD